MKRVTGRSLYVTRLSTVIGRHDAVVFAGLCRDAHLTALWLRLARGDVLDTNFATKAMAPFREALTAAGVEVWGWHVPFCRDQAAATKEAKDVLTWSEEFELAGLLIDAERTDESPRFQGSAREAETYCQIVSEGFATTGRGLALSSHDQPPLHRGLPFEVFLRFVADNCPQVYYNTSHVELRLNKSIAGYRPLEAARDFQDRFKPTGNITVSGDVKLPDIATCHAATKNFISRVEVDGFKACSFWCLDEAPPDFLTFLGGLTV